MSVDGADDDHSSIAAVYAQVGENYRRWQRLDHTCRSRRQRVLHLVQGTGWLGRHYLTTGRPARSVRDGRHA